MTTLIKNIKQLIQVREGSTVPVSGVDMGVLPTLDNAWLLIQDGLIADFGVMNDGINESLASEVIDATGRLLLPCWCDSHTHIVYAGSREQEFVQRINGASYEEIANAGGGILNSAKLLNQTSEDSLYDAAYTRAMDMIDGGTGAIEIKSGYGLTMESELKMLRVIKRLKENLPIEIKATFLGAHAIPAEYKDNRLGYIDLILNNMLPEIHRQGLADYCDVFCDQGFFSQDETERILAAANAMGIRPKIHANELARSGGVQAGVSQGALSVDHLEQISDEEIQLLLRSDTIPTVLPATSFFLGIADADARRLIDAGLPLALASDYNPGSAPSGNMSLVVSLACIRLKLRPEEAINAATLNSAFAMGVGETHGSITRGKKANLILTKEIPSYAYIPYSFGISHIQSVLLASSHI